MANVKISQLPSWTGSSADLRWFVMNNSGETETFKFSGYTSPLKSGDGTNSVVPVYNTSASNVGLRASIVGGVGNTITSTQDSNSIFGGNSNSISSPSTDGANTIVGGFTAGITQGGACGIYSASATISSAGSIYNTIMGAQVANITSGNRHAIHGGNYQNITGGNNGFIGAGNNNTISGSDSAILGGTGNNIAGGSISTILNGETNTINGGLQAHILGGFLNTINAGYTRSIINGGSNNISGTGRYIDINGGFGNTINGSGFFLGIFGGIDNTLSTSSSAYNFHSIYYSQSSTISATGAYNNILGSNTSTIIGSSSYSQVIGGSGNTLTNSTNSSIINSKNSSQNSGATYTTDRVTMIACENTDITNATNSVVLAVSGRTIPSGQPNTTYVDKMTIFGNTTYEATTFNTSGNCNIDIFNMSHVIINATGGTYTLTISPEPSQEGTPEITLLINVTGGATIAFNNSGNTQWRWGNGAGTPTFTDNTRSIIKMAAWAGNDVYEISRSMNMA
jgi:hypothetical protein